MSRKLKILVLLLVAFVAIQFVPVECSNPPVVSDFDGPAEIAALLRRACYDCHSNETRWPWYARVAPVSWLLAEHVEDGRKHLNFSEWDEDEAWENKEEIGEEVGEGEMPLKGYALLHAEARLSEEERAALLAWAGWSGEEGEEEEEGGAGGH
ncbi:MAG: heme-binding protein [Planctomycetota bacterium]|nr:MAG: heme-binding protein [Planctomycetota bacterium]